MMHRLRKFGQKFIREGEKIKGQYREIVKFVRGKIQRNQESHPVINQQKPQVSNKIDDSDGWGAPVFVADSGAKTKIGVTVNSKSGRIGVRSFYLDPKTGTNYLPSGNGITFVSKEVAKAVAAFINGL